MDYKELIDRLRGHKENLCFPSAGRVSGCDMQYHPYICTEAADAIEALLAERDAAMEDMRRKISGCGACKWGDVGCDDHPCCDCIRLARWSLKEDLWEWRGPQKEGGGDG